MTEHEHAPAKDFAQALAEFESTEGEAKRQPAAGEKIKGRVVSIGEDAAFVDLGAKAEGVIALSELKDRHGALTVKVGEEIEATVAGSDAASGAVQLRVRAGRGPQIGDELRQAYELKIPVEGQVYGFNKGGAEVKVYGLRAFCPNSQLDLGRVEDALPYVGQRFMFRVIRLEEGKGRPNVVLSRRVLLEEEAATKAAAALEHLKPGTVVRGKVVSLQAYGAFMDIGGIEGLLHVSEISHVRLAHPSEALQVGQELEVQVTKIEKGKEGKDRISLSRRALEQDPWRDVEARFPVSTELDGMVRRLETFGAFVEVAPGIEGLLHISEFRTGRRLNHAREAAQLGQTLKVRVLSVDPAKRRISLGTVHDASAAAPSAEHPERAERPQRQERPDRPERRDRAPRSPRPESGGDRRGSKMARTGKPGRAERGDRPSRERPDRGPREPVVNPQQQGSFGALADFFKKAGYTS